MYSRILVTLENSPADATILDHVREQLRESEEMRDPATEIAAAAEREQVDLIAMATHGHRFLNDLVRGSVANEVRHRSRVPVLLVRA
ncbi:MAG: universal stress protein [Gemmatimonadota bacterium]